MEINKEKLKHNITLFSYWMWGIVFGVSLLATFTVSSYWGMVTGVSVIMTWFTAQRLQI